MRRAAASAVSRDLYSDGLHSYDLYSYGLCSSAVSRGSHRAHHCHKFCAGHEASKHFTADFEVEVSQEAEEEGAIVATCDMPCTGGLLWTCARIVQ